MMKFADSTFSKQSNHRNQAQSTLLGAQRYAPTNNAGQFSHRQAAVRGGTLRGFSPDFEHLLLADDWIDKQVKHGRNASALNAQSLQSPIQKRYQQNIGDSSQTSCSDINVTKFKDNDAAEFILYDDDSVISNMKRQMPRSRIFKELILIEQINQRNASFLSKREQS